MSEAGDTPRPPSPTNSGPSIETLISTTCQAQKAMDRPINYSSTARERVVERASSLLHAEGIPKEETVPLSDQQLMGIVDYTLSHLVKDREENNQPVEGWEPEILSVQVHLQDSRNADLLDREDPMQARIATETFRGQEGLATTVTLRYANDANDDRVFTDTYGIDEQGVIKGAPYPIDVQRYEGRRIFPDVNELMSTIQSGDIVGALTNLSTIPEGRRDKVFTSIGAVLNEARNATEMEHAIRFLLQGTQKGSFSIERLADSLAWPSSNPMRKKDNPRYLVFRKMPEYPQAIQLLKAHLIPQDENGSNVSRRIIEAIPWVIDQDTITDDEFQRLANLLPSWQRQVNTPGSPEQLLFTADALARELPYIAQTPKQTEIALQTFQSMNREPRAYLGEAAERGITNISARKLLEF